MVSPEPCINCEHTLRCGLDELACKVFAYYVENNRYPKDQPKFPDKKIYIKIFEDDDGQVRLL